MWLYTPVYYHTQVRAVGVGLGICSLKVGTASAAVLIAYLDMPFKLYSFAAFSLVVMCLAVVLSEPRTRKILFAETDAVIETRDLDELYKHHHVPPADLGWHIRNIQIKEGQTKKEVAPFANEHSSTHGPDFNWVDVTPSAVSATTGTRSLNYSFSVDSSRTPDPELPLSAFRGRTVYRDVTTPGKPTFNFDRSLYPIRKVKKVKDKGKFRIRPMSAAGLADERTYILTPTEVRSEGNTPDPSAALREQVIVKRTVVERPPDAVYENVKKRTRRRSSGSEK